MISTGNGDFGKSSLIDCSDISKCDLIFDVLGTIDELSAFLGVAKSESTNPVFNSLENIQKDFVAVAECFAGGRSFDFDKALEKTEKDMITYNCDKLCLNSFVLYGATKAGAKIDVARAVLRRLERLIVKLSQTTNRCPNGAIAYFNRLSDYLFVISRYTEKGGN